MGESSKRNCWRAGKGEEKRLAQKRRRLARNSARWDWAATYYGSDTAGWWAIICEEKREALLRRRLWGKIGSSVSADRLGCG